MNGENIKNNDPLQLQQMIIFLKAELAKHKSEVKKYQDSYHYSVVENLEAENLQLMSEKKELAGELVKLKQEFEKRVSYYKGPVHLQGLQGKRYITSIDTFQKTNTDLLPISKQLNEVINKLKDGVNTDQNRYKKQDKQVSSIHKKFANNKTTIEQLENKLVDLIQETNKQVHIQMGKIDSTNEVRAQYEKERQRLIEEVKEKNSIIGKLHHDISNLKQQNNNLSEAIAIEEKNLTTKATIDQLENKLVELIREDNRQVHSHLKKLDIANKERSQSEKERYRLLLEIKEKNNTIGKLHHEISNLKRQNDKHSEAIAVVEKKLNERNESQEDPDALSLISTTIINSEELIQLDHQIKEVLAKSLEFEEELDAKLLIINTLEHKLNQLTVEIDGINFFSVEGRISKES